MTRYSSYIFRFDLFIRITDDRGTIEFANNALAKIFSSGLG